jgi:hypothetical protein
MGRLRRVRKSTNPALLWYNKECAQTASKLLEFSHLGLFHGIQQGPESRVLRTDLQG